MRSVVLVAVVTLAACADKGAAVEPPIGGGKDDIADRVDLRGPLALGGEARAELTEDLEFHGYTLDVRPGATARLDITHAGSSSSLDSTLFVYGPARAGGGYGTEAIAYDDDSGWGNLSRLKGLKLEAGGTYLVVIGSFDGRGRGRYRATATCQDEACDPVPTGLCHPVIAADIRACAVDVLADPDVTSGTSELDAVELCSDAEPAADAFDAVCASAEPAAFCGGSYEEFAQTHLVQCMFEMRGEVLDRTCALGTTYHNAIQGVGVHVVSKRVVTSAAELSALERDQVVLAAHASSHDDVTTAEQALDRFDQGEVNVVELWDTTGRRSFTAFEYGAGDNSYGRIFARGTTETAALIGDGDLRECAPMHGAEGRSCAADSHCAAELSCAGIASENGRGLCRDIAADNHPDEGSTCTARVGCAPETGLLCAGLTRDTEGLCLPAWLRRATEISPGLDIEDGAAAGTQSSVIVSGLATVDTDVSIGLRLIHPDTSQLKVTLTNPAGVEVVVFDGRPGQEIWVDDHPVVGFSGDEEVNGVWTLRVIDQTTGETGVLDAWSLTVGSRFD